MANNTNNLFSIEKVFKKIQYESYEEWIHNFALNLPNIWNENSANILSPKNPEQFKNEKHSAIVIGRGPSIEKHSHLKLLAESDYQGSLIICDGKLIDVLKAGITPDKFPRFYVVTIDPYSKLQKFYDHSIVNEFGQKINGLFTSIMNPNAVELARNAGIKIHWFHNLFDFNEGKKSFNYISSQMVRAQNHKKGLPGIQTGGNVGTSCWFLSWRILCCSTVALIGINHGWNEDDPWETIISHGNPDQKIKNSDNKNTQKLIKKIHNPDFNCNCILDPTFQFYSTAFKEFISRSPSWVNTLNATEGGSIFGDRITSMYFRDFLEKHNH